VTFEALVEFGFYCGLLVAAVIACTHRKEPMARFIKRRNEMDLWHYESDDDQHSRTHYAVRNDATRPGGIDRKDFISGIAARTFVAVENHRIRNACGSRGEPDQVDNVFNRQ
jgi:hypothetical protein